MKVRVYHKMYGCQTGCCGHVVELEDGREHFEFFAHPDGDQRKTEEGIKAWAKELVQDTILKSWPECFDTIDWDSMVIETEEGCSNANV